MGLFSKLKELFSARRYINRVMAEMDKQNERYAAMTKDELLALPDDELCSAVLYRIDQVIAKELGKPSEADPVEAFALLDEHQRTVFVLACWESEWNSGGLCKFLTEDCGGLLPYLPTMLARVNATEHLALLSRFAQTHGVDLTQPSPFFSANEFDRATIVDRFPFPDFDIPYHRLPQLEDFIVAYMRKVLNEG